ncbi:hypothetical protein LP316_10885 [Thalassotalea sp. LPB0316]|uniref:DUF6279 family lipoprotein n=1 Tax=Thalassotalea sp. LPB0316 TaxID=2769490 RepID=UPI0018669527|nr:DUF6279 family lipoprotein [Thalassotalea sp. LPB0316]QOL24825.1 hypothetical protein LP316_10885 [Thalassotalea sp. LPB0316]
MPSISRIFTVIVLTLMLSGCSFSFVYNKLDWWVNWYLDDYVELDKTQQHVFDKAFEQLHLWHRKNELMRYHAHLSRFQTRVNEIDQGNPITADEIYDHVYEMRDHWYRFITFAEPYLTPLLAQLSAEQKQQLINKLAERNEEMIAEREESSYEKRIKENTKSQKKSFKKWFGKLSKAQNELIEQTTPTYTSSFDDWIAYRQTWLSNFETALIPMTDNEVNVALLTEALIHPQNLRSKALIEKNQNNNRIFAQMFADFLNQASAKQIKRFNRRVSSYLEDFEELANDK